MSKNLMVVALQEVPALTLDEICQICGVEPDLIEEMIAYGIIEPYGTTHEDLRFNQKHLRRVRITSHLHQDLEINMAGAALVIEMMDEMEHMRTQLELFKRYIQRG